MYIHNPKLAGSGVIAAIPQKGLCPLGCKDCFFQSGRSYLEPLEKNLPNMPSSADAEGRVVRVNDGNDSNNDRAAVIEATKQYRHRFFNTSCADNLEGYPGPVVLTVNPGEMTDVAYYMLVPVPKNLMFVRFRANMWNTKVCDDAVQHYANTHRIPVVLTFMAYYELAVPETYREWYEFRKRTLNSYWCIGTAGWERVMKRYEGNPLVYACGKDAHTYACSRCGNCLREYFATAERMELHG